MHAQQLLNSEFQKNNDSIRYILDGSHDRLVPII